MKELEERYYKLKGIIAANEMYKTGIKVLLLCLGIYLTYYLISSATKTASGIVLVATIISRSI